MTKSGDLIKYGIFNWTRMGWNFEKDKLTFSSCKSDLCNVNYKALKSVHKLFVPLICDFTSSYLIPINYK